MENLFIEATENFPTVSFNTDGVCRMEGKSIPEDVVRLFTPLFTWAKMAELDKMELDINLYYFNTATSKQLFELFKFFEKNTKIKEIAIRWHFEEGDDEMMEAGEMYEDMLKRSVFEYVEYAEMV